MSGWTKFMVNEIMSVFPEKIFLLQNWNKTGNFKNDPHCHPQISEITVISTASMRLSSHTALVLLHCYLPVFIKQIKEDMSNSLEPKWISFCCCSSSLRLFCPLTFYFFHSHSLRLKDSIIQLEVNALKSKKANLTSCRVQGEKGMRR